MKKVKYISILLHVFREVRQKCARISMVFAVLMQNASHNGIMQFDKYAAGTCCPPRRICVYVADNRVIIAAISAE